MALAGLAVALAALGVSWAEPHAAIVLAAAGNALFHVGAGAAVLRRSGDRAAPPGLFVAPGALGLLLGVWLGLAGLPGRGFLALALVAAMVLAAVQRAPRDPLDSRAGHGRGTTTAGLALGVCVALLLLSIAARSALGDILAGPWRGLPLVALALTLAAVAAKALSGFVADRFGWRAATVSSLLALALLSATVENGPAAAVAGMVLLQAAMPVTLAALRAAFPRKPGTAFGLASAAILLGAVPGFLRVPSWPDLSPLLAPAVLVTAGLLYLGLAAAPADRTG
jgi:FSR family fosmidomycin resistance protein-like MFS transporter